MRSKNFEECQELESQTPNAFNHILHFGILYIFNNNPIHLLITFAASYLDNLELYPELSLQNPSLIHKSIKCQSLLHLSTDESWNSSIQSINSDWQVKKSILWSHSLHLQKWKKKIEMNTKQVESGTELLRLTKWEYKKDIKEKSLRESSWEIPSADPLYLHCLNQILPTSSASFHINMIE